MIFSHWLKCTDWMEAKIELQLCHHACFKSQCISNMYGLNYLDQYFFNFSYINTNVFQRFLNKYSSQYLQLKYLHYKIKNKSYIFISNLTNEVLRFLVIFSSRCLTFCWDEIDLFAREANLYLPHASKEYQIWKIRMCRKWWLKWVYACHANKTQIIKIIPPGRVTWSFMANRIRPTK